MKPVWVPMCCSAEMAVNLLHPVRKRLVGYGGCGGFESYGAAESPPDERYDKHEQPGGAVADRVLLLTGADPPKRAKRRRRA
jgi:hypothetical protein